MIARLGPKRIAALMDIVSDYPGLFLDAYGVLVNGDGLLPGSCEFIAELNRRGHEYLLVSNSCQKTTAAVAAGYRRLGLDLATDRILTSGSLLREWLVSHDLVGARIMVVGPSSCHEVVAEAGAEPVSWQATAADGVFLASASYQTFPVLAALEAALSLASERLAQGAPMPIVIPNGDLVFPRTGHALGVAVGSLGLLLEAALRQRFGADATQYCTWLGKPQARLFAKGMALVKSRPVLMVGDQLDTDIAGAQGVGIASALMLTGLAAECRLQELGPELMPTYVTAALLSPVPDCRQ